jgi:hypothetical protein
LNVTGGCLFPAVGTYGSHALFSRDYLPPCRVPNAIFKGPDGLSEIDTAQNPEKLLGHFVKKIAELE